ncbi:MAG: hypothetical protein ACYCX6_02085 [Vulcanimicrobiaceae bacterium]
MSSEGPVPARPFAFPGHSGKRTHVMPAKQAYKTWSELLKVGRPKNEKEVVMASRAHLAAARPAMINFLAPILGGPGRSCGHMGRKRAEFEGLDTRKKGRHYGEMFARLLRDEDSRARKAYPSPEMAWYYAEIFRFAGDLWAAGPLVLYGVGHLEAFVQVIAGTDRLVHSPTSLLKMIQALPRAIRGETNAQRIWRLSDRQRAAFPSPAKASGRRLPPDPTGRLTLARSRARTFDDVPFDLQRQAVRECLTQWLQGLGAERDATA